MRKGKKKYIIEKNVTEKQMKSSDEVMFTINKIQTYELPTYVKKNLNVIQINLEALTIHPRLYLNNGASSYKIL